MVYASSGMILFSKALLNYSKKSLNTEIQKVFEARIFQTVKNALFHLLLFDTSRRFPTLSCPSQNTLEAIRFRSCKRKIEAHTPLLLVDKATNGFSRHVIKSVHKIWLTNRETTKTARPWTRRVWRRRIPSFSFEGGNLISLKLPSCFTCFLLNISLLLQATIRQRYQEETLLPNLDVPSSMFYALV